MAIEEVSLFRHHAKEYRSHTRAQEFSIEIPDKEADAIHSSRFRMRMGLILSDSNIGQLTKRSTTYYRNLMVSFPSGYCARHMLTFQIAH